jgi:hypothetical protein
MSRGKDVLKPYKIITAGNMSASSITSLATNIQYLDNICLEMVFTGSPTGTFSVQGSVDYQQDANGNVTNTGNWVPITLSPAPVASGSAGSILIDMNQLSFPYIRVVYTRTSGSGSLTVNIGGKQL